jgi:dethiobiotin synthetase
MMFITGTDTDCGKTTVGRALARVFRQRGLSVACFKPVETGCHPGPEGLVPTDALALARAAGCELPLSDICPERFALAASPEVAAAAEGRKVSFSRIAQAWERVQRAGEMLIVEGAGGALVPLQADATMLDLVALVGAPVIVVARDALGTVNHTLLTIEAIRTRNLPLAGVILSATQEPAADLRNGEAIVHHGRVRLLGTIPHLPQATDDELAEAATATLDLGGLTLCLQRGRLPECSAPSAFLPN